MIGDNIKKLRTENNMTQKELAEKLFVTPQAVSRWENGEVDPSVSTVADMAKIFNCPGDEILGIEGFSPKPEVQIKKEYVVKEAEKPVLAVCEQCNRPIYEPDEIVRKTLYGGRGRMPREWVLCSTCENENIEKQKQQKIDLSKSRRTKSFILGGLAFAVLLTAGIIKGVNDNDIGTALIICGAGVLAFTFISCLFFANNFIGEMTSTIIDWGFVRMPGVIFTLDLDGIIWLITVKLALFLLSLVISLAFAALGISLGLALSIFVYPFALYNNINHPEKIED